MSTKKKTTKTATAKTTTRGGARSRASAPATPPPAKLSLLAAAIEVLKASDEPLNCRQMVAMAKERGLWSPGAGKTPEQTLYSSIKREIVARGDASRFVMSPVKGHFTSRAS